MFMYSRTMLIGAAFAAAVLAVGAARAQALLDTGKPSGRGAPQILSSSQWLAGEFAVTSAETDRDYLLSAYLTLGEGTVGDTFTFDIYSNSGFLNRPSSRPAPVFTATGTFTGNGWNFSSSDWAPTVAGDYWLALQVSSSAQTRGLDAPVESSATTGSVPALGFAYASSGGQYTTSGAEPIGLDITADGGSGSDGPLPLWALAALGAGLLGIASHRFGTAD